MSSPGMPVSAPPTPIGPIVAVLAEVAPSSPPYLSGNEDDNLSAYFDWLAGLNLYHNAGLKEVRKKLSDGGYGFGMLKRMDIADFEGIGIGKGWV